MAVETRFLISDSAIGNWTDEGAGVTNLYDGLNDASDTTEIVSGNNPAYADLYVGNFAGPSGDTIETTSAATWTVRYAKTGGRTLDIRFHLRNNGTNIVTRTQSNVGTGYVTQNYTLTAQEKADVKTAYDAGTLEFAVEADTSGGGAATNAHISEQDLEADFVSASQSKTVTESGSGADGVTIASSGDVAESASGSGSVVVSADVPTTDVGVGADVEAVSASVPVADSGSGADVEAVSILITVADSGSGSDGITSPTVQASVTDSGTGIDTEAIDKELLVSETATGADSVSVDLGGFLPDSDAQAYVNAVEAATGSPMDRVYAWAINNLVEKLKTAGVWAKLDRLGVFLNETETGALIDLKDPTVTYTKQGAGAWTARGGFEADGSTLIDLKYNLLNDTVNWTLSSATWGIKFNAGMKDVTGTNGTGQTTIRGSVGGKLNSGSEGFISPDEWSMVTLRRVSSTSIEIHIDGGGGTPRNSPEASLENDGLGVLGENRFGGRNFMTAGKAEFTFAGATLTEAEVTATWDAFNDYINHTTLPFVVERITKQHPGVDTNGAVVDLPAVLDEGDIVVLLGVTDSVLNPLELPAGVSSRWKRVFDDGSNHYDIFVLYSDGTEGGSTIDICPNGSNSLSSVTTALYRIKNAREWQFIESNEGLSSTATYGQATVPWWLNDNLHIPFVVTVDNAPFPSGYDSSYDNFISERTNTGGAVSTALASAEKYILAEDVTHPSWTLSESDNWYAGMFVFRPLDEIEFGWAEVPLAQSDITDQVLSIDLSRMPQGWWDLVNTDDATKGRAFRNGDQHRMACDWVEFDRVNQTGWLHVRWDGIIDSSLRQSIRIYPPDYYEDSELATATYGSEAVWINYEAVFHLNEDPTATAPQFADATGNGYDLTSIGTMTAGDMLTDAPLGFAIDFDGTDDSLWNTAPPSIDVNSVMFTAWAKGNTAQLGGIIGQWDINNGVALATNSGGEPRSLVMINYQTHGGAVSTTAYEHLAMVANNGTTSVYRDGVVDTSTQTYTPPINTPTGDPFVVGGYGATPDQFFSGSIGEARYAKTALLSADQIAYESDQGDQATFWGTWELQPEVLLTAQDYVDWCAKGNKRGGKYMLGADLDMTGVTGFTGDTGFWGDFDGRGHVISNITAYASDSPNNFSLFSSTTLEATYINCTAYDFGFENCSMIIDQLQAMTGMVFGRTDGRGTWERICAKGSITVNDNVGIGAYMYIGGFVGRSQDNIGEFDDCYADVDIINNNVTADWTGDILFVGGFIGYVEQQAPSNNVLSFGDLSQGQGFPASKVGGIIGNYNIQRQLTNWGWSPTLSGVPNAEAPDSTYDLETAQPSTFQITQNLSTYSSYDMVDKADHWGTREASTWLIDDGAGYPKLWFEYTEPTGTTIAVADTGAGASALGALASVPVAETATGATTFDLAATMELVDTGASLDEILKSVGVSVADLGTGTDAVLATIQALVTDAGASVDSTVVAVALAVADLGLGADAASVLVNLIVSDTSIGVDTINVLAEVLITVSDAGTGVDAVTLSALLQVLDTASGLDSDDVAALIEVLETAAGADDVSLLQDALIAVSDAGIATDAVGLQALLEILETGVGADDLSILTDILISVADSGGAVDGINIEAILEVLEAGLGLDDLLIAADIQETDTGSGLDNILMSIGIDVQDTGAGIEEILASIGVDVSDLASAVDTAGVFVLFELQDSATGTDVLTVYVDLLVTDAGLGTDQLTVLKEALRSVLETGVGADSVQIQVNLVLDESAAGLDIVSLSTESLKAVADVASVTDNVNLSVLTLVPDTATGIEQPVISVALNIADIADGADSLNILSAALKSLLDTGGGVDSVGTSAVLNVTDQGFSAGVLNFSVSLDVADSAQGVEQHIINVDVTVNEQAATEEILSILAEALINVADQGQGLDDTIVNARIQLTDEIFAESVAGIQAFVDILEVGDGVDIVAQFDPSVFIADLVFAFNQRAFTFTVQQRKIVSTLTQRSIGFHLLGQNT